MEPRDFSTAPRLARSGPARENINRYPLSAVTNWDEYWMPIAARTTKLCFQRVRPPIGSFSGEPLGSIGIPDRATNSNLIVMQNEDNIAFPRFTIRLAVSTPGKCCGNRKLKRVAGAAPIQSEHYPSGELR